MSGGASHCTHALGAAMREVVDWRPSDYITQSGRMPHLGGFVMAGRMTETIELTPTGDGGTRVHYRARLTDRGALSKLASIPARFTLKRVAVREWQANWDKIIEEDGLDREAGAASKEAAPSSSPTSNVEPSQP